MSHKPHAKRKRSWQQLLVGALVIAAILAVGAYSVHTSVSTRKATQETDSVTSSAANEPSDKHEAVSAPDTADWAGLDFAHIPHGDLDAVAQPTLRAYYASSGTAVRDDYDEHKFAPYTSNVSPERTALEALNVLFDQRLDDDTWSNKVRSLFHPAGDGVSMYAMSPIPRWWLAERYFSTATYCKNSDNSILDKRNCDGITYVGTDANSLIHTPNMINWGYEPKSGLTLPADVTISSLENPEKAARKYYTTVEIPMNDGMWNVTEYCPAAVYGSYLTTDGKYTTLEQLNKLAAKAKENTVVGYGFIAEPENGIPGAGYGDQGFATPEHPCQVIEITVGGQKPFWKLDQ